jgi:GTPase
VLPKKIRKSGYVALIGRTNAGKSTFLNAVMEAKVAIVSDKPQTTRKRLLGIKTGERGQIVFFDSPGVHKPQFRLNERMMKEVGESLQDADLVLYFIDISDHRTDEFILEMLDKAGKPAFLVINKIDTGNKGKILLYIDRVKDIYGWKEVVPISALRGINLDVLENLIYDYLPEGEDFFPADQLTQQSEKFYLGELIREKILVQVYEELPYIITVRVQEITDRGEVVYINAEIIVESDSQRMIILGKRGQNIKKIGETSRQEIEEYLDKKVYLELFVKKMENWRNSPMAVKELFNT